MIYRLLVARDRVPERCVESARRGLSITRDPRGVHEIDCTQSSDRASWGSPDRGVEVVLVAFSAYFRCEQYFAAQNGYQIRPRSAGNIERMTGELVRYVRCGHDRRCTADTEKKTATDVLGSWFGGAVAVHRPN